MGCLEHILPINYKEEKRLTVLEAGKSKIKTHICVCAGSHSASKMAPGCYTPTWWRARGWKSGKRKQLPHISYKANNSIYHRFTFTASHLLQAPLLSVTALLIKWPCWILGKTRSDHSTKCSSNIFPPRDWTEEGPPTSSPRSLVVIQSRLAPLSPPLTPHWLKFSHCHSPWHMPVSPMIWIYLICSINLDGKYHHYPCLSGWETESQKTYNLP